MSQPVKVALVGCGSVSQRGILPHLRVDDARAKADLVAVCDVDGDRARATAERFGVPGWYADYQAMLREADLEAVLLATPIPFHFEQARAAIEAGKHVYVQKAMTTSLGDADELVDAARAAGVKLVASPGQMLSPGYGRIRDLVSEGALGRVYWVMATTAWIGHEHEPFRAGESAVDPSWYYRPGGGPMLDMGVYSLHTVTGILGPARRVLGLSGVGLPVRRWAGHEIAVEMDDNTVLMLELAGGTFVVLGSHFCSPGSALPWGFLGIYGSERALEVTELEPDTASPASATLTDERSGERVALELPHLRTTLGPAHAGLEEAHVWADILELVDCIRENRDSRAGGEHARHVIEIMEKGYLAARSGQAQELRTTF